MNLKFRREYGRLVEYVYENVSYKGNLIVAPMPRRVGAELQPDELPSVTRDRIFKRMFGMESTKQYACMLFASIFEINDMIEFTRRLHLYTNEIPSRMIEGREVRLDFVGIYEGIYFSLEMNNSKVRLDFVGIYEGIYFSLEMNNSNKLERNADYASRLYSLDMKNGRPIQHK